MYNNIMDQDSTNIKPKYSYYKTHKDKYNEYIDCECGGRYCKILNIIISKVIKTECYGNYYGTKKDY